MEINIYESLDQRYIRHILIRHLVFFSFKKPNDSLEA